MGAMTPAFDLARLFGRAFLIQLLFGAPFGIGVFSLMLSKTGSPLIAWAAAFSIGCYRAVGLPIVLGGAIIGVSDRPNWPLALLLAGLPTSLGVGFYMQVVGRLSMGRAIGGFLSLWVLASMLGLVGYGLGRIALMLRAKGLR